MRPIALVLIAAAAAGALSSLAIASATGTSVTGKLERAVRKALRQPQQKEKPRAREERQADRLGRESPAPIAATEELSVRDILELRRQRADAAATRREKELRRPGLVSSSTRDAMRARRAAEAESSVDRLRVKARAAKRAQAEDRLRGRGAAEPAPPPTAPASGDRLRGGRG